MPKHKKPLLSTKFVLKAEVKNKVFGNISNSAFSHNSNFLNINFNNKTAFQDTKSCKNSKFQEIWIKLEMTMFQMTVGKLFFYFLLP